MTTTASIWLEDDQAELATVLRELGFRPTHQHDSACGVAILDAAEHETLLARVRDHRQQFG